MKPFKIISSLLFMALMAVVISTVFQISVLPVMVGLVLISLIPLPKGIATMALQKEIWESDIVGNLYKDNQFATRCYNADQFVLAGKVVHMATAGAGSTVKKNLTVFPQTATNRTDTEDTWALDTFYALPRQVQDIERMELAYDKRMSIVGEDVNNLVEKTMNGLLWRWAGGGKTAAKFVETAGADSGVDLLDDTATGTRKMFTKEIFSTMFKKFGNANLGNTPRTALLTVNHYNQFYNSLSDGERTGFNSFANPKEGIVGRYMGFDVIMRSTVLRYRKVSTVWTLVDEQDDAFAPAVGDSAASFFWAHPCVTRGLGDVHTFEDNGNPLYYGDVWSAYVRMGGRIRRPAGVYAVIEAIGS